jgi:hypothetical protein
MASAGGVAIQPPLGKAADAYGYASTYVASAALTALAVPFLALSRRQNEPADTTDEIPGGDAPAAIDAQIAEAETEVSGAASGPGSGKP